MFGPLVPHLRCETFVNSALLRFGLLWWLFAIYWTFVGLGDLEKPETGGKKTKKQIFLVLGAVIGETPAYQTGTHAKCGPTGPCLKSQVSLGPEIWPLGGGLRALSWVGDRCCPLGTQPIKKFGPKKIGKVVIFLLSLRFQRAYFRRTWSDFGPLCPYGPMGAVRAEKTWPFSGLRRGNTKSLLGRPQFYIRYRGILGLGLGLG